MKIHKGDDVIVLSGKYRGERANVEEALPRSNKVILDNLNIAKRATKQPGATMQAGIIDKFMPLSASNVAVWCPKHKGPAQDRFRDRGRARRFASVASAERSYDDRYSATPQGSLRRRDSSGAQRRAGPRQHHAGAAPGEDRAQLRASDAPPSRRACSKVPSATSSRSPGKSPS